MTLSNYTDVSRAGSDLRSGFQFEFRCQRCSETWKSPLKPYRRGQFAGLIYRFAYYLGDRGSFSRVSTTVADAGSARAKESALQEALAVAEQRYTVCPSCERAVCERCWDSGSGRCEDCSGQQNGRAAGGGSSAGAAAATGSSIRCPNCGNTQGGGRFCPECGFDMASTHKSCPGCGTMCLRSARFCADCGHGF